MRELTVAITAASYYGNKGAAAMLQSAVKQLYLKYGAFLTVYLMSTYPKADKKLLPFDFIKVVSCKPLNLLFIAFPAVLLFYLFNRVFPIRLLLKKNKIIRAYTETDIVLDMAGVSFVDSRGFIMNIYAAVTMIVPLMMKIPVVKYSQGLGSFKSFYNRMLAKTILPKMALIIARGEITRKQLSDIGIIKNVKICADGAFTMPDDKNITSDINNLCKTDDFYLKSYISLSPSSVVESKCKKLNINYHSVIVDFIKYLTEHGFGVLLIANAARLGSKKPRNNDLPICDKVYNSIADKRLIRYYHEEMPPEKIRELIGRSLLFIGSRFHAMIAALEKNIPVLILGWSHKYKEVLDMFSLGSWVVDYKVLSKSILVKNFNEVLSSKETINKSISENLPDVKESSLRNIQYFCDVVEQQVFSRNKKIKTLQFENPEVYTGSFLACRMGYAADKQIRDNAASGGMVTTLLCSLLRQKKIDGAWVTRSFVENGEIKYKTFIAITEEEIKSCSSSIYVEMPLIKHISILENFNSKCAVVMLPCQLRALNLILTNNPSMSEKLVLRISLYCGGVCKTESAYISLLKRGIKLNNRGWLLTESFSDGDSSEVKRIIFRKGHYRGRTIIQYSDGTEKTISYTKTFCAYKNAFFYSKKSCMLCQDHFGRESDISFGDVWLSEMKKNPIKHTSCIIHNKTGLEMYNSVVESGDIIDFHFTGKKLIHSQFRSIVFKYNCAKAKVDFFVKQNKHIKLDTHAPCRWNHRLAYALASHNQMLSDKNPKFVEKLPLWFVYYYMCFIRLLLNI